MKNQFTDGKWEINRFKPSNETGLTSHGVKNGIWEYSGSGVNETKMIVSSKEALKDSTMPGDFIGAHVAEIPLGYENDNEAEANAKLIAAAPELLQNCIWCINNFKNVLPVATKEESERIYYSLIENLDKAIKNATV